MVICDYVVVQMANWGDVCMYVWLRAWCMYHFGFRYITLSILLRIIRVVSCIGSYVLYILRICHNIGSMAKLLIHI